MNLKQLTITGITCLIALVQTARATSIAVIDYSPGEFQGFGAPTHNGTPANESIGPFTFANIDGSGVSLSVSATAPAITEFIGNSTFTAPGFHMGDASTSTFSWNLSSGYMVNWVEFSFRYLSEVGANEERLSGFSVTGASITSASLSNASGVTWNGSVIDTSIGDGSGTFRIEFGSGTTGFGWTYNLISGDPQGATITQMKLDVAQVPEPSSILFLGLTVGLGLTNCRRSNAA